MIPLLTPNPFEYSQKHIAEFAMKKLRTKCDKDKEAVITKHMFKGLRPIDVRAAEFVTLKGRLLEALVHCLQSLQDGKCDKIVIGTCHLREDLYKEILQAAESFCRQKNIQLYTHFHSRRHSDVVSEVNKKYASPGFRLRSFFNLFLKTPKINDDAVSLFQAPDTIKVLITDRAMLEGYESPVVIPLLVNTDEQFDGNRTCGGKKFSDEWSRDVFDISMRATAVLQDSPSRRTRAVTS